MRKPNAGPVPNPALFVFRCLGFEEENLHLLREADVLLEEPPLVKKPVFY